MKLSLSSVSRVAYISALALTLCTIQNIDAKKKKIKKHEASLSDENVGWFWMSPKKTIRNMNFVELEEAKERYKEQKDSATAIKCLEKMVVLCHDLEKLCTIMLELADLLYQTNEFEKAEKMYQEFMQYYPGNNNAEYAFYHQISSSFAQRLDTEHDTTKTKDTIALGEQFLQHENKFENYKSDVTKIIATCQEELFESEINIANFYITTDRYASAYKRIDTIKKEFLPAIPEKEEIIILTELSLAQKQNNSALITEKETELSNKFPVAHEIRQMQATKQKKGFFNKF